MKTEDGRVSLVDLARGAAIEAFDHEFQKVMNNIVDPNTAQGVRTVTLKVMIKPNEDRTTAQVAAQASSKLLPAKPFGTILLIGQDRHGNAQAFEHNPDQLKLGFDAPPLAAVRTINGEPVGGPADPTEE